ncbi:MAG TPA: hypothetical protein VGE53_01335 [Candidatus Paceibacterota bacterium]|jgi:hypothetical protein
MTKKYIKNAGKKWNPEEVKQLKELAKGNTPTRVIGLKLGRPEAGVRAKASEKKIKLAPPNQSPYNRRKK